MKNLLLLCVCALVGWSCASRKPPTFSSVAIEDLLPPSSSYEQKPEPEIASEVDVSSVVDVPSSPQGQLMQEITVRLGDTLWGLSQLHQLSVDQLIDINGLEDPYNIFEGDILLVPKKDEPHDDAHQTYRVQTGDTFYSIARRHGVSLSHVWQANGMSESTILREGMVLTIPAKGTMVSPPQKEMTVSSSSAFVFPVHELLEPRNFPSGDEGMDIVTRRGAAVRSIAEGDVIYAGNDVEGYGNLLLIRHNDGWVSAYGHNESLMVGEGDRVMRGQTIARAGTSGSSDIAQLYFELRRYNRVVNPRPYLEPSP